MNRTKIYLRMIPKSNLRQANPPRKKIVLTATLKPVLNAALLYAGPDEIRAGGFHHVTAVAEALELSGPVVRTRASLHAYGARRQFGNRHQQLITPHHRAHQGRPACFNLIMQCEQVIGEIDPNKPNSNVHHLLRGVS